MERYSRDARRNNGLAGGASFRYAIWRKLREKTSRREFRERSGRIAHRDFR